MLRINDAALRSQVRELAVLAGASVPSRPWEIDLQAPHAIAVFGQRPHPLMLTQLGAHNAISVGGAHSDALHPQLRHYRLPTDTAALLSRLGQAPARAKVIRIQGLHGGAGTSYLAACFARYLAAESLRVILVDTDPMASQHTLLDVPPTVNWQACGSAPLPLRLAASLPSWQGVRILAGQPPPRAQREAIITQLRQSADVVIVDDISRTAHRVSADESRIALGCADWRTAHAWPQLAAQIEALLVVRTRIPAAADELLARLTPPRAWVWKSERHATSARAHGQLPGARSRSAAMRLVRELWQVVRP